MANMRIELPYGHDTIAIYVPREKLVGTFVPRAMPAVSDPGRAPRDALTNPAGGRSLRAMAAHARQAAIVIEDATRPVPNSLVIEAVMPELEAGGISPQNVTVIVATGLHRPMSDKELAGALGRWFEVVNCENHDAHDPQRLTHLGTTSLGTDLSLNRSLLEADFKITTGDIEQYSFIPRSPSEKPPEVNNPCQTYPSGLD